MLVILLVFSIFINICLVVAVLGFMEQEAQQYLIIRNLENRIEHWKILDREERTKHLRLESEDKE